MRSPLELKPELIEGLGLVTARWAALDLILAELLAAITGNRPVGEAIYYAPRNFLQRIDILNNAIQAGIVEPAHTELILAVFRRLRRKWFARNRLIHSHYGYRIFDDIGFTDLLISGAELEPNLENRQPPSLIVGSGENEQRTEPKVTKRAFGYFVRDVQTGRNEFNEVNRATFTNHAAAISKHMRQIRKIVNAINRGRVPVRSC